MEFTVWSLVTDLGIVCALLMVAQMLRATLRILQASFLPASTIAGTAGLALGPNGVDVLPFSAGTPRRQYVDSRTRCAAGSSRDEVSLVGPFDAVDNGGHDRPCRARRLPPPTP
jgi:hypothetical protein